MSTRLRDKPVYAPVYNSEGKRETAESILDSLDERDSLTQKERQEQEALLRSRLKYIKNRRKVKTSKED